MSTEIVENIAEAVAPAPKESALIVRAFDVELQEADGRTLIGRCVPYNERALVADPPHFEPYHEEWLPGVFDQNVKAANRVLMDFEHQPGIAGIIGRGLSLHSEPDGFYGEFKVYPNGDGDKALEMYHDGVLNSLSISAKPIKSVRAADGTMQRVRAHLDRVALCRQGAFEGAKVLASRTEQIVDEADLLPPIDPVLVASLSRLGLAVPDDLALRERTFTTIEWDGAASRFDDTAAYCRSCLIDDNPPGAPKIQALCHLPIREPNGDYNVNAIRNALARVDQVSTSSENKARARRRLETLLASFNNQSDN